ncbi:hypothetical protein PIB30_067759 [Stylosanthes scabra]|uniref:Uncharacterized protein n=1 Tax=Stylosanthes scabra TaxID=79078 RepID=A0ABU6TPX6_9FABA|nr:hypothetical protein [Stylosanthes scabra]
MKRTNKTNRASSTSGYTGGSITYPATALKMAEELGCTPTDSEVFTRTHMKKKDWGQWVDKHVEDKNVYRRGKVSSCLKPLVYISEDVSTANGPVDMREHVTLLNQELTQQAEEHREEVAALCQQHATYLTRLQSSLDTQSIEFDRWKSIVSQMYTFMQHMQGGSSNSSSAMSCSIPRPPSPLPPAPLQPSPSSATDQPQPDGDKF